MIDSPLNVRLFEPLLGVYSAPPGLFRVASAPAAAAPLAVVAAVDQDDDQQQHRQHGAHGHSDQGLGGDVV